MYWIWMFYNSITLYSNIQRSFSYNGHCLLEFIKYRLPLGIVY